MLHGAVPRVEWRGMFMRSIFLKSCWRGAVVAVGLLGAIAACSDKSSWTRSPGSGSEGSGSADSRRGLAQLEPGEDPLDGVTPGSFKPLATALTFDSSTGLLTVTLTAGELGMVSLRSVDNAIIVN